MTLLHRLDLYLSAAVALGTVGGVYLTRALDYIRKDLAGAWKLYRRDVERKRIAAAAREEGRKAQ